MTNLDAKALEFRTRELFTECPISPGAIKKEIAMQTLTREESNISSANKRIRNSLHQGGLSRASFLWSCDAIHTIGQVLSRLSSIRIHYAHMFYRTGLSPLNTS